MWKHKVVFFFTDLFYNGFERVHMMDFYNVLRNAYYMSMYMYIMYMFASIKTKW